ncbi:MAG: hypothetical protein VX265_12690 [Myxococcota bacterium]|nr:hypothetical protein [Myxococcota bacterium]
MTRPALTLRRWLMPLLLLLAPAMLGLATGSVGERTTVGAAVLWSEPFLLAVGLWGVLVFASERHLLRAVALSSGLVLFIVSLRQPIEPIDVVEADRTRNDTLWECANLAGQSRKPIRLLTWTLRPERDQWVDTDALLQADPDLVVLHGLQDADVAEHIARALDGEAKVLRSPDSLDGVALVVRGAFQYCGGREDSWSVSLPGPAGHGARAVLTFPALPGVGVVPLLAVRLSDAGGPSDWRTWPDRLVEGARRTAAIVAGLGPRRMIVVGDFGAPPTFRRIAGHMSGAGLSEVAVPATWPSHVAGLPSLPLHALDRVWVGEDWGDAHGRLLDSGVESRAPLLVELNPL